MKLGIACILLALLGLLGHARGHGRLMDPPSRSSMWRFGFNVPRNYDDNALYCGGFARKQQNGGKCGVCGDNWSQPAPRDNEAGGKYGKGIISKTYTQGQTVNVKVQITANHAGWMEFRICPNNDVNKPVTHACLDKTLLELADGSGTRYTLPNRNTGFFNVDVKLPDGMTCNQCVIQWKYHAGNSWGVDPVTFRGCVGCGPQEEFYGCSDVSINSRAGAVQPVIQNPTTTTTIKTIAATLAPVINVNTPTPAPPAVVGGQTLCRATNLWAGNPDIDRWCTKVCNAGRCPSIGCDCSQTNAQPKSTTTSTSTTTTPATTTTTTPEPTTTTTTPEPTTTTTTPAPTTPTTTTTEKPTTPVAPFVPPSGRVVCRAINNWAGIPYLDRFCADSCALGNCPPDGCKCEPIRRATDAPTTTTAAPPTTITTPTTTTAPSVGVQTRKVCRATNHWQNNAIFDQWCTINCNKGNCPPDACACVDVNVGSRTGTPKPPPETTTTTTTTTPKPTTRVKVTTPGTCRSNGVVAGQYWDNWCKSNCDRGYCELEYCYCN